MPFPTVEGKKPIIVAPGVTLRTAWGESIMFSLVEFAHADATVATHQHPHEQMGMVLEGELELICGGERRTVGPGGMFLIPSNTPHSARAVGGPARALDVFHPRREDYMVEGGEVILGEPEDERAASR
jgi:quercetin dioxygenase-like cupin family protein